MYTDFYLSIWQSGIANLSSKIYGKIVLIHEQIPVIIDLVEKISKTSTYYNLTEVSSKGLGVMNYEQQFTFLCPKEWIKAKSLEVCNLILISNEIGG